MRMSRVTIGPNYSVYARRYCVAYATATAVYRSQLLQEACYLPYSSSTRKSFRSLNFCSRSEDTTRAAVICRCECKHVQIPRNKRDFTHRILSDLRYLHRRARSRAIREDAKGAPSVSLLFANTKFFSAALALRLCRRKVAT